MENNNIYDGCHDMIALLENSNNSLWLPSPTSLDSLPDTILNFDMEAQLGETLNQQGETVSLKRNRGDGLLGRTSEGGDLDLGEEELDVNAYNSQADKKRRLTQEQVKYLEKSFELENKLEPERKVELAKQLGLQPRQVAIWFQNRRARYKSKQIEKEYDTLKANYDQLKMDYDFVCKENKTLRNERDAVVNKLAEKEMMRNESTNPNVDILLRLDEEIAKLGANGGNVVDETGVGGVVMPSTNQAEDVSSAKSSIFDSESPICRDGNHSSSAVPVEASSNLMRDLDQQSDFSQEDDENLLITSSLLLPQTPPTFNNFLKVPDEDVNFDPNNANANANANSSCNFSLVDDEAVWPWLY